MRIDLNSDLGESFGPWTMGQDAEVMRSITSANVACGFHAGDPGVMRNTFGWRAQRASPSARIRDFRIWSASAAGTWRRSPGEVEDFVLYQIGAIAGIAAAEGVRLQHVKAHGALYNMAAKDRPLADAIAKRDRGLRPHRSSSSACRHPSCFDAGRGAGLRVAAKASPIARTSPTAR